MCAGERGAGSGGHIWEVHSGGGLGTPDGEEARIEEATGRRATSVRPSVRSVVRQSIRSPPYVDEIRRRRLSHSIIVPYYRPRLMARRRRRERERARHRPPPPPLLASSMCSLDSFNRQRTLASEL